jgi:hypothetical protein
MKSKGIQFWTLLILSSVIGLMLVWQIVLSHAIIREQHVLVDWHEKADSDSIYQTAWEKLAMRVYKASAQDPALLDLLKSEGIAVHQGPPPGSTNAAPAPAPGSSSKPVQATPPHPAAP